MSERRRRIAARAARELQDGQYVNLGIGLPTAIPAYVDPDLSVMLQSENGVLGVGNQPPDGEEHPDLIDAGKQTITVVPGASYFDSALSFAMIRGGHIDLAVLGAMEVSQAGDLASWSVPGSPLKGMGGAMDLVHGARRVIVTTEHRTWRGEPKLRHECTLPLTGAGVVDRVITDLAVIDIVEGRFTLVEIAPDVGVNEVLTATGADVVVPDAVATMAVA